MYLLEDGLRNAARVLVAGAVVVSGDLLHHQDGGGRPRLLATAGVVVLAQAVLRGIAYAVVRRARARGLVTHRTLVLGAGRVGAHTVQLSGTCAPAARRRCVTRARGLWPSVPYLSARNPPHPVRSRPAP